MEKFGRSLITVEKSIQTDLKHTNFIQYSTSYSDEVQNCITRCRGTAVPCPYRCTSLGRETLYCVGCERGNKFLAFSLNPLKWVKSLPSQLKAYFSHEQVRR